MCAAWAATFLATDPGSAARSPPSVSVPGGLMAEVARLRTVGQLPYEPQRIAAPTLLIQGEWDGVVTPEQSLRLYARLSCQPRRFVVLGRGGHRMHLESGRAQLFGEIAAFLAEADARQSGAVPQATPAPGQPA